MKKRKSGEGKDKEICCSKKRTPLFAHPSILSRRAHRVGAHLVGASNTTQIIGKRIVVSVALSGKGIFRRVGGVGLGFDACRCHRVQWLAFCRFLEPFEISSINSSTQGLVAGSECVAMMSVAGMAR